VLVGTITDAGTVTAELLLDKLTVKPPTAAAVLKDRVQASVPDPVIDPLLQDSALNAAGTEVPVMPVPLRLTVA